jgi:hypothetical protein
MLRIFIFIFIFILVIPVIGGASFGATLVEGVSPHEKKPNDWQPIIGMKIVGGSMYIDANSLTVNTIEGEGSGNFNSAEILATYDRPTEVVVEGKKYIIRSMVRSLVIECKTGLSAPVFDVYFEEPMPNIDTIALTGIEWPSDIHSSAIVLSKKSSLYNALCPIYI